MFINFQKGDETLTFTLCILFYLFIYLRLKNNSFNIYYLKKYIILKKYEEFYRTKS